MATQLMIAAEGMQKAKAHRKADKDMGETKKESQRAATKAPITKDGTKKETATNKVVKTVVPKTIDGNPM